MTIDHDLQRIVDRIPHVSDVREAASLFVELEQQSRRLEATKALLLARVNSESLHRADGYVKASAWVRSVARLDSRRANDLSLAARLISSYPEIGTHYFAGEIAPEHVRRLASLHQNKRVSDQLPAFMPLFLEIGRAHV